MHGKCVRNKKWVNPISIKIYALRPKIVKIPIMTSRVLLLGQRKYTCLCLWPAYLILPLTTTSLFCTGLRPVGKCVSFFLETSLPFEINYYHFEGSEGLDLAQYYDSMISSNNLFFSHVPTVHNKSNMMKCSYIVPDNIYHKHYIKGNCLY